MNTIILVYITTPTHEVAHTIARALLEKKLIACANIHTSESSYWWESTIQSAQESIIIAKTFEHRFEEVQREIEAIHPYKVPCVLKITAHANKPFFLWMKQEIKV